MTTAENPQTGVSLLAKIQTWIGEALTTTPNSEPNSESNSSLSVDEICGLLNRARRREVLCQLAETEQRCVRVADLAEAVAASEYDCRPSELGSDDRKRVYIALQQSHLPRLASANVVVYERDTVVTLGPEFDSVWAAYMALRDTL